MVSRQKKPQKGTAAESKSQGRATPRPSSFVLGEELEYRVARLHLFMGYFVRRGCPILTVSALDRATDLDVLAVRYVEPFERQMIIAECKSGENSPLDRIFWLSGVRRYTEADEAFLVRKTTKWNIKDFAKECGVQILDLHRLAELEHSLGITDEDWPAVSDRSYFENELPNWNVQIQDNPRYWELLLTLTSEVRWDEPFSGVNYLLAQLRLLTRNLSEYPENSFHRFLLAETLSHLSVFLLRLAEQCFDLGEADRHGLIRKGLTYGNLDPKYAERILTSAYNLSRQSILHYTNQTIDLDKNTFSMPEPPGTDTLIELIDTMIKSYPACLIFPQVTDIVLSERFVKRKDMRRLLRKLYPHASLAPGVGLLNRYLSSLVSMGACPAYVQDVFARGDAEHASVAPSSPQGEISFSGRVEKTIGQESK